ncbi:unnamed protein product [Tenebrio molitor]|nr:unnamed protein product [Tenebrio molitor]
MAPCERPTCATILTYYSAVAHVVSGVAIILMTIFTFFVPFSQTPASILFSLVYAIVQLVLGSVLLCGIFKESHYWIPHLVSSGHNDEESLRYLSACQHLGRSTSTPTGTFLRHILLRIPLGYFLLRQEIQSRTSWKRHSHLILNIKLFLITFLCYVLHL